MWRHLVFSLMACMALAGCTGNQLAEQKQMYETQLKEKENDNVLLKGIITDREEKLKKAETEKAALKERHAKLSLEYNDLMMKSRAASAPAAAQPPAAGASDAPKAAPAASAEPMLEGQGGKLAAGAAAAETTASTEEKAKTLEKDNAARADTIIELSTQLRRLTTEIAEKDRQIAGLKKEIDDLNAKVKALEEKDAANAKLIAEKDRELGELKQLFGAFDASLMDEIKKGTVTIVQLKDAVAVRVNERVFFDSGSIVLKSESKTVLDKVVEIVLKSQTAMIRVEGHTDDKTIGAKLAKKFPTNWELSTARATSVMKYLSGKGIEKKRVSIAGYAENRPLDTNETKEGREKNRRIEIIVVPK